jgi:hypothetical protein
MYLKAFTPLPRKEIKDAFPQFPGYIELFSPVIPKDFVLMLLVFF